MPRARLAILLVLGITPLIGACAHRAATECVDASQYERQAVARSFTHANGVVAAAGRGLRPEWDRPPYTGAVSAVRIGRWNYWYESGAKHAEVTYAAGCYIQCCSPGPCPQLYDYPAGSFTVWYPSGRKLAEGSFDPEKGHIETSCEGGDDITVGHVSASSRFWREDGSAMTLADARATGYLPAGW